MTLTGIKKHIRLLKRAELVVTEERGRTRYCELSTNALDRELAWIDAYRVMVSARMDHLEQFLNRTDLDIVTDGTEVGVPVGTVGA